MVLINNSCKSLLLIPEEMRLSCSFSNIFSYCRRKTNGSLGICNECRLFDLGEIFITENFLDKGKYFGLSTELIKLEKQFRKIAKNLCY